MYHAVIGAGDDAEHALVCIEKAMKLPDEPDEKGVTLVHNFVDSSGGASAMQIHSVREAGEFFEDCGIEYDVNESSDDPAEVTIEFVDEEDADLAIIAGRRRPSVGKALSESVTQTVILSSDCPVAVTRPTKRKH